MALATPMGIPIPAAVRRPTVLVPVTIYAIWWNVRGLRIRGALQRIGIPHHFVDIEVHPDAKALLRGAVRDVFELPVIYVDGDWLIAPAPNELKISLQKHGLCEEP